jgi:CheY-like chemotaxis protein
MTRIILLHWNAAEGEERAAFLGSQGHEVELQAKVVPAALRAMGTNPPHAIVIDLSRQPSQGREVAGALRRQKATRAVPIIFVGGEPDKVARVRELLPDALFTDWPHITGALKRAFESVPANPVIPGTMASYSATPLPRKLGIQAGSTVALLGAPDDFVETLGALPEGVQLCQEVRRGAAVILLFARSRAELQRRFPAAAKALAEGGRLWILWPKKASGVSTDLAGDGVRAYGLGHGYVDYKIAAIDQTWSGLAFARRKAAS